MALSNEDVRQILSILESSTFDSIEIRMGDISIAASKSGPLRSAAAPQAAALPASTMTAAPIADVAPKPEPTAAQVVAPEPADEEGLIKIRAPMVGSFYVAPKPGEPAFVTPGDTIDHDTTIAIIEVMKVFTNIKAEVKGTVVRCLVKDGDLVEFEQPIFLIRPAS